MGSSYWAWDAPFDTSGRIQRISYHMSVETSSYKLVVMLKDGQTKRLGMCKDSEFPHPTDRIALYEAREQREEIPISIEAPLPLQQPQQKGCSVM